MQDLMSSWRQMGALLMQHDWDGFVFQHATNWNDFARPDAELQAPTVDNWNALGDHILATVEHGPRVIDYVALKVRHHLAARGQWPVKPTA